VKHIAERRLFFQLFFEHFINLLPGFKIEIGVGIGELRECSRRIENIGGLYFVNLLVDY
jgi:hypothetical protein